MKHQVKRLLEDTRAVLQRLDEHAEAAEKAWHENDEPHFRALRDMLTERLRRGKVITPEDVTEAFGGLDLDGFGFRVPKVFRDYRAGVTKHRRYPVARIITSRPNVKTEVYYQDLVDFVTLLLRLREEDGLGPTVFTRAHRFVVTDQELTDLGFNRFPAVVNRIKESANLRQDYAVEVRA